MKQDFRDFLDAWPRNFIKDSDIASSLGKSDNARYSLVKRACQRGLLKRIRKGLYLITSKSKISLPDEFELAIVAYEPSIVSLESALSYHGLIPEAVYTTTCVTPKRAQSFLTPFGRFSYYHVPAQNFYEGVVRISTPTGVLLIAQPWRALADLMYMRHRTWETLRDLDGDLRIDIPTILQEHDRALLVTLSKQYPSRRVRTSLRRLLKNIKKTEKDFL